MFSVGDRIVLYYVSCLWRSFIFVIGYLGGAFLKYVGGGCGCFLR